LEDSGREPRFIHTIPNVGYSFRDEEDGRHARSPLGFGYPGKIET